MSTVYENYYIGAFIHALGFLTGMSGRDQATALGLYQQGPLDRPLGDLLWSRGGRHTLIEFKAKFAGLAGEAEKKVKGLLLSRIERTNDAELRTCSFSAHFIAVGGWEKERELLHIGKYASLIERSDRDSFLKKSTPLSEFAELLLNNKIGAEDHAFKRYLSLFQECVNQVNSDASKSGSSAGSSGTGSSATIKRLIPDAIPGGLLVTVDRLGTVSMLPFSGVEMLRELNLSLGTLQPDPPVRKPTLGFDF
jgi:hypothetical protein